MAVSASSEGVGQPESLVLGRDKNTMGSTVEASSSLTLFQPEGLFDYPLPSEFAGPRISQVSARLGHHLWVPATLSTASSYTVSRHSYLASTFSLKPFPSRYWLLSDEGCAVNLRMAADIQHWLVMHEITPMIQPLEINSHLNPANIG